MITVLAVDQSLTCTGIMVLEHMPSHGEGSGVTSIEAIKSVRTKKTDEKDFVIDTYNRSLEIGQVLVRLAEEHKPDYIVFEAPSLGSVGNASRTLSLLLGSLLAQLGYILSQDGVKLLTVPPTSLKKFATGKGVATKDQMVEAVKPLDPELYTFLHNTPKAQGRYDLCDSYFLAQWVIDKES